MTATKYRPIYERTKRDEGGERLHVEVEVAADPAALTVLRRRLWGTDCRTLDLVNTTDGLVLASGLLAGLPSRDTDTVARSLLAISGVKRVRASYFAADGTILAEAHLSRP